MPRTIAGDPFPIGSNAPMAWIHTEPVDGATGRIAKSYRAATERAGRVAGIVRLMSCEPTTLEASMGLYAATTTSPRSPLLRWFRELIAARVSEANDCHY